MERRERGGEGKRRGGKREGKRGGRREGRVGVIKIVGMLCLQHLIVRNTYF